MIDKLKIKKKNKEALTAGNKQEQKGKMTNLPIKRKDYHLG